MFSLEAGCLALQLQKSTAWNGKVIFQGGSIIFSQKILHEPPPSISPVESFEFFLEALTSVEAEKVWRSPCPEHCLLSQSLPIFREHTALVGPFPFPPSLS